MSADNWRICPKCRAVAAQARQQRIEQAVSAAHAAYGVASAEKYLRLSQEVTKAKGESLNLSETLREDYDIGVDNSDAFIVVYQAECTECGFTHMFKHFNPLTV